MTRNGENVIVMVTEIGLDGDVKVMIVTEGYGGDGHEEGLEIVP